jgi:GH25 family lysozyme M1 (1,4-beta-N-acetylmuramidase)
MASQIKLPVFLDISYWTVVEWDALVPLPWLVCAKASEGFQSTIGAFQDPRFQDHARNIKRKGIRRSAYHFLRPGDIGNQAEFYISVIKQAGFDQNDILVLDWEDAGNTLKDAIQWLEHIERVTGQRPLIYSSAQVVERLYGTLPPSWFKDYKWWLAGYPLPNADSLDTIPDWYIPRGLSLEHVAAWQYDEDGVYPGILGNKIDLNWMNPTWMEAIKLKPPTQGEHMTDFTFSITPAFSTGSKVRPEPDTGNTPLANIVLPFGKYAYGNRKITITQDKFENNIQVNKVGDIWLEVLEVNGVALSMPAYIAEIHMGTRYATITQLVTPTDPPPPTPEPAKEDIVFTQTFAAPGYRPETVTVTLKPESTGQLR